MAHFEKARGKWKAQANLRTETGSKQIHLGRYDSYLDARIAEIAFREKHPIPPRRPANRIYTTPNLERNEKGHWLARRN